MLQQTKTQGGVHIEYEQQQLNYSHAIDPLLEKLNSERGALFASDFEYPGRYTCWDIGFHNPPLAVLFKQKKIFLEAFNQRGEELLVITHTLLSQSHQLSVESILSNQFEVKVKPSQSIFNEEERSKQPSVFTVIRELLDLFKAPEEPYLGLYGAFGYDLIFQFEALEMHKSRFDDQRDMVLYLPDEIYVVNHRKEEAFVRRYDFNFQGKSTQSLAREGQHHPYDPKFKPKKSSDHEPGEYARLVDTAKERFKCGDLFEVVPSQMFYAHCSEQPSAIFTRMREKNPSPYGFFINLGENEYLVGASPEMYVRVQGKRIESCPISGTIKRGADAIEDAKNIQTLLDSDKEFAELTMCTDVDRNDKSRVCVEGSVNVIGRRQIEMYSRLIHTVDHVEGILRDEFDAVDAFLTHMWVVTVTGAPKLWAMNFIEKHEKSPRRWYAGAVGWFGFNGNLNTGLVLRTLRIKEGIAEIRVGATLLYDSIPKAEEQETQLKASAFLELLQSPEIKPKKVLTLPKSGINKEVILVDHQDSFVHTLANYLRQTGAKVRTIRSEYANEYLRENPSIDLVVLSPGPGKPSDFHLNKLLTTLIDLKRPVFGVCLGLQGIVEYFNGRLAQLSYPMHGKASTILVKDKADIFQGLPSEFTAGRYHSLYACPQSFPDELKVTATTEEGIIMAISHKTLPIYAVQFHPETILSLHQHVGYRIIDNVMRVINAT